MEDELEMIPSEKGLQIHGPFKEYRASMDGYKIPYLDVRDFGGETLHIMLDRRFGAEVPRAHATEIIWLIANAIAVGAGYTHFGEGSAPRNLFNCKMAALTLESVENLNVLDAGNLE